MVQSTMLAGLCLFQGVRHREARMPDLSPPDLSSPPPLDPLYSFPGPPICSA